MRMSIALVVLLVACGKGDQPPPPTSGSPNAQPESGPRNKPPTADSAKLEAERMFFTVCATCHGEGGTGDGPGAETLNPKPRNYTDPAWQASVTDDEIKQIIVAGGAAVGKSAMMPPNPQLKDKPEVLDAIVQIIRGFGKK